jgi:hypothetical protein
MHDIPEFFRSGCGMSYSAGLEGMREREMRTNAAAE